MQKEHSRQQVPDNPKTQNDMKFREVNLDGKTAYVNSELCQMIQEGEGRTAVLVMNDGTVYNTAEDYEELLEQWGIIVKDDE